jgi:hypothetical protein
MRYILHDTEIRNPQHRAAAVRSCRHCYGMASATASIQHPASSIQLLLS